MWIISDFAIPFQAKKSNIDRLHLYLIHGSVQNFISIIERTTNENCRKSTKDTVSKSNFYWIFREMNGLESCLWIWYHFCKPRHSLRPEFIQPPIRCAVEIWSMPNPPPIASRSARKHSVKFSPNVRYVLFHSLRSKLLDVEARSDAFTYTVVFKNWLDIQITIRFRPTRVTLNSSDANYTISFHSADYTCYPWALHYNYYDFASLNLPNSEHTQ